jgi:hypothetical protein
VFNGKRNQQASRRLGVQGYLDEIIADGSINSGLVLQIVSIPTAASGEASLSREASGAWKEWELLRFDHNGDAAAAGHFEGMPQQPETGHVRTRVHGHAAHHCRCPVVQRDHRRHRSSDARRRRFASLQAGGDDPGTERFGEDKGISGLHADVADHLIGMHDSGDGHAVLQLFVDDAVAADHDRACCPDALRSAVDDVGQHAEIELTFWERDDVERRSRSTSHCVHVAQRVRRSDLAERIRVVHNRREEVDGVDDRQILPQTEYPCVVGRFRSDDQIGMRERREAVQHVQQVGRAELGRSTSCGNLLRESQKLRPFASGDLCHARVIVESLVPFS